jgi:RHS repeat-associated protein
MADSGIGADGWESFSFDTLGQMLTASNTVDTSTAFDSPASYKFNYDLVGNTANVAAALGIPASGDSGGATLPTVNLASKFDYNGNRTELAANIGGTASFSTSDGSFAGFGGGTNDFLNSYLYDTLGQMTDINQSGGGGNTVTAKHVHLGYDFDGQPATIDAYQSSGGSNQVYHAAYGLDADGNLTDLTYKPASTSSSVLAAYHWDYTANGLVNDEYSRNDGGSGGYTGWAKTTYGYDADLQLNSTAYSTLFANPPTSNTSAGFDANGNRFVGAGSTGAGNRMLYDGAYFYQYDANGNRIAKYQSSTGALDSTATDITIYGWNEKNEMTSIDAYATYADYRAGAAATQIAEQYDAFGNMVSRTPTGISGESPEYFIYDGSNVALILNEGGGVVERELSGQAVDQYFASEAGPASATLSPNTVDWLLTDNQGTVRDVVQYNGSTGAGAVVDHLVYDSEGQMTSQNHPAYAPTFTYAGMMFDADAGLYNDGLRKYDAVDAVFASQDPLGFGGGQTNTEVYCGNSATNGTDPSGTYFKRYNELTAAEQARYWENQRRLQTFSSDTANVAFSLKVCITDAINGLGGSASYAQVWVPRVGMVSSGGGSGTPVQGPPPSFWQGFTDEAANIARMAVLFGAGLAAFPELATAAAVVGTGWGAYQIGRNLYQLATRNKIDNLNNPTGQTLSNAQAASLAGSTAADSIALGFSLFSAAGEGGGNCQNTCFVAGTPVLVPDEVSADSVVASGTPRDLAASANRDLLFAAAAIVVGIAGHAAEEKRARRANKRRRDGIACPLGLGENDREDDDDFGGSDDGPTDFACWRKDVDELVRDADKYDEMINGKTTFVESLPLLVRGARTAFGPESGFDAREKLNAAGILQAPSSTQYHKSSRPARTESIRRKEAADSEVARRRMPRPRGAKPAFRGGRWWLAICLLIAALFAGKAVWLPSASIATLPHVSTVSSVAAKQPSSRSIELIRVGQRVIAGNPEMPDQASDSRSAVDPATWRLLRLHAEDRWPDGTLDTIEVETLQPSTWIKVHGARPGAVVPLPIDVVEMGMPASLRGKVAAVEPCPRIADGPGKVVLTTISHLNAYVFSLTLTDQGRHPETIRATGYHKFYSADRRGWVSVDHMRAGEHLPGVAAMLTLTSVERLPGVQRVYNMTVEKDHVYHVATVGALVHNAGCEPGGLPTGEPDVYGFKPEGYEPPLPEHPLGEPTVQPPTDGGTYNVAASNPHLAGETPLAGTRGTGVARARAAEVDLVRRTGAGTIEGGWTPAEVQYIQQTGHLPNGVVGHHINNVAQFPEWAGDPRNIQFVRGQAGNLAEHGGNFQNPTTGPLINR